LTATAVRDQRSTDKTEHERQRGAEQLRLLHGQMPLGIGISLALAVIYAYALWQSADHAQLLGWVATLGLVSGWRASLFPHHGRFGHAPATADSGVRTEHRAGALLAGFIWGVTPWLFYPANNAILESFSLVVLAGVISGATTSLAADFRSAAAFQAAVIVPVAAFLALRDRAAEWPLILSIVLYGTHALVSARRTARQMLANIDLRLDAGYRERRLQESESRYRQLAHFDALTGLLNRHALVERLTEVLGRAASASGKAALIYIDIDHFKDVNDTHGHSFGDQLLVQVAHRLARCVRGDDVVVRMGGDEFVVITANAVNRDSLVAMTQRIRDAVSEPLLLDGIEVRVRVSLGIGLYPDDGQSADVLMKYADIALYQAKAGGRNGYRFFDARMNETVQARVFLERALTEAIGTEQLFLHYQPIVDVASRRIVGLEALIRWRHPERGLMSPAEFIPMAERSGLINAIGEHVLRTVCAQQMAWQAQRVPLVPIAVNVSPRQFEHGRLADTFIQVIDSTGIDPALVQIEITETALMRDVDGHARTLNRLREFGVKVAIDDFGTGYSSLSYLKHLPIDCLKIDRSFVSDMISDTRDAAIVSAVIGIARSLGIVIVAEGVESQPQFDHLRALDCDAAQGYLLHRPMSADRCQPLLEQLALPAPATEALRSDTAELRVLRVVGGSAAAGNP
jgi:diguanylate cyclase (GGDEF)-like protein